VSSARRAYLAALLTLALGACGGGGAPSPNARIGQNVTFNVPLAAGSNQVVRLEGIERGRGAVGVVLAHQLGSSQESWAPIVDDLVDEGFHVLSFNFRGHGLSGGHTHDPSHADLDLAGAIAKLRSLGAERVLVVGASMGGTAAVVVAARENLAGIVSLSAPSKIDKLDAGASANKVREPSLFIVGAGDAKRYVDASRSLYAAVGPPKDLEVVSGSSEHGTGLLTDVKNGAKIRKLIINFCIAHRG
jgi:pimeloyl-ACP methyl ester carboxylesterase